MKNFVCPKCSNTLISGSTDRIKVRAQIFIFEKSTNGDFENPGGVICKKCKTFVKLPIKLDFNQETLAKCFNQDKVEKHFVIENVKRKKGS